MNKKFLLLICLLLTACAADPRKEAAAYKVRAETDQAVQDAAETRKTKQALDAIAIQEAERTQAVKDAGLENAKRAASWLTYWGGIALTLAVCMMLLSVGAGGSVAIIGSGKALARAANVKANLIYLDRSTGQYPQLLEYIGGGKYSLTDMNDHSTLLLDTRNEPDRLAVQGAIAIRHALVMSSAASRSGDPTGVAMIPPLIIDQEAEV